MWDRQFFFEQAYSINKEHGEKLAESEPDDLEADSGITEIREVYGFYSTLQALTGGDITKQKKILVMSVAKVHTFLEYNSRMNAAKELYWEFKRERDSVRNR